MPSVKMRPFVAVLSSLLLASCSAASFGRGKPKTAEELYEHAVEDLKDHLYPEALSGFADVKARYPYSKYAALADLRTGDTYFKSAKYAEAIDAYREFVKLHPNHEEVPYALFSIGETYYEQLPTRFILFPPAAEKDQGNTRAAITAYEDLLKRYPKADLTEKAKKRLEECRHLLAEHELYVAEFYCKRQKWLSCAGRAEGLSRDYPGVDLEPQGLLLAAQARQKRGEIDLAREAASKLLEKYPSSEQAKEAKKILDELSTAKPAPAPVEEPEVTPESAPEPAPEPPQGG